MRVSDRRQQHQHSEVAHTSIRDPISTVNIGRIRLGDFRGALLGHAHMRRSRLCSTKICESNRNCIVFIKDDGSDGD